MSTDLSTRPNIAAFLDALSHVQPAYPYGRFSYVALLHNGEKIILRARLEFLTDSVPTRARTTTANLFAGEEIIQMGFDSAELCVQCALSANYLPLVDGALLKLLPTGVSGPLPGYSDYYERVDISRASNGHEYDRLVLSGIDRELVVGSRRRELSAELREIGYDHVDQLARLYGLDGTSQTTLEITAGPVAYLGAMTALQGRRASIHVRLSAHLELSRLRITLKSADQQASMQPLVFGADSTQWTRQGIWNEGVWLVDLPTSDAHSCRVLYAGAVQDQRLLFDPSSSPNIRRMLLSIVDPDLKRLRGLLLRPADKQRKDFEAGVALLFQMLGFAPAHIGAMSGLTDEPDIFVSSPTGDVLLVECTTGVPDDRKLSLLVSRSIPIREIVERAQGVSKSDVIAILVTPRLTDELAPIREKASANNVLLLCHSELSDLITRTATFPDAVATLSYLRSIALRRVMTGGYRD
jgi:hypothetical protein